MVRLKGKAWPCLVTGLLGILCATAAQGKPGDLNAAFGVDGQVRLSLSSLFTVTGPVAIDRMGRIIGGMSTETATNDGGSTSTYEMFALLPDGRIDTTFGTTGTGFAQVLPNAGAQIAGVAIDPQNRIVVIAATADGNAAVIERLLPDGIPDPAFAGNGVAVVRIPSRVHDYFSGNIALDSLGNIFAAGEAFDDAGARMTVMKVDVNGNPANLGENGVLVLNPGTNTLQSFATAVALDSNGEPLVSGAVLKQNGSVRGVLVKITDNGTPDVTFGNGGSLEIDALPAQKSHFTEFTAVTFDSHNRIVVTGPTFADSGKNALFTTRLLANGSQDPLFKPAFSDGQVNPHPSSVDVDSTGKIVVSGTAGNATLVYRLRSDGSPDVAFGQAGQRQFDVNSLLAYSTLTSEGDIVLYSGAENATDAVLYELKGN